MAADAIMQGGMREELRDAYFEKLIPKSQSAINLCKTTRSNLCHKDTLQEEREEK